MNDGSHRLPLILPRFHIAVVDDDPGIRVLLSKTLAEGGYDVSSARNGTELQQILSNRAIDLVLLDIMMPGIDGLQLCRMIRMRSKVPIIMVSARGQEADRVVGLDLGADDYVGKPFGAHELLARIRAVLRRAQEFGGNNGGPAVECLVFAGWRYHRRLFRLIAPSDVEIELTAAEHELLLSLLHNPQRVVRREELLELAGSIGQSSARSVDILISRIRRKMGDNRREQPMIRTVRGLGYMLAVDVELS